MAAPDDRDDLEAAGRALATERSRPLTLAGDIGEPATARDAVSRTLDTFGRLDFLVANAGILASGDTLELKLSDLDALWHVNVRGIYLAATEAARGFSALLSAVEHDGETFVITRSGRVIARIEPATGTSGRAVKSLLRHFAVDDEWSDELGALREGLGAQDRTWPA